MVESHPDAPEVHGGSEGLADRFPQHGPLVHVGVEILLSSVQRHELLIVLQLPGGSEVRQLVDDGPVVLDELHDVARLEVPVDQIIITEMIHPGREMGENQQELVLIQTVTVLWIIQEIEETSPGTELHDDNL